MACSRCERLFSSAGLRLAGSCATCPDGDSLCQNCVNRHASDARFAGHLCRTLGDVYAGADILARLGLVPAPKACPTHSQPFLDVQCVACSRADADVVLRRFCASCVNEHAHTQPAHVLAPFAPNIAAMRTELRALPSAPADSRAEPLEIGGACKVSSGSSSVDIITTARRRALAVHVELESLAVHKETALAQLEANRDAVLAALWACVGVNIEAVHAAAAAKQSALEAELGAADSALDNAVYMTEALAEVR